MKKIIILILVSIFIFSSCSRKKPEIKAETFALDTVIDIVLYNSTDEVSNEIINYISELEKKYSFYADNKISQANSSDEIVEIDEGLRDIIKASLEVSKNTEGSFDITIGSISKLWDFHPNSPKIADDQKIEENLKYVDYKNIELTNLGLRLKGNSQIDLGGIAKGYICDELVKLARDRKVESAIFNLGGNTYTLGLKGDRPFKIGIRDPFMSQSDIFAVLDSSDEAVVTSGVYQRYIKTQDSTYHHILDPKTGYPAESELVSVTVIGKSSMIADAYATGLLVLGKDRAIEKAKELNLEVILVDKDSNTYVSDSLKDRLKITNERFKLKYIK